MRFVVWMSHMSKLLKNSVVYSSLTVLQKSISFFLLPLYTSYLTPADYGTYDLVITIISVLAFFYTLALRNGIVRFYSEGSKDELVTRKLFGTSFYAVLLSSAIQSIIYFSIAKYFFPLLLGDLPVYPYMYLGLMSLVFSPVYQIVQSILQAKQDSITFTKLNLSYSLVLISLNIVLIVGFNLKAEGLLLSLAVTNFVFSGLVSFFFIRKYGVCFDYEVFKKLLKYCLPLLPHNLSTWTMSMIDRILIKKFLTTFEIGLYSVGFQISNILGIGVQAFSLAYSPFFFETVEQGETGKLKIVRIAMLGVLVVSLIGMFLSLYSREIIQLMAADSYSGSYKVIPFLSFVFVFQGVYIFIAGPLLITNTKLFSVVSIFGALLNIGLNFLLIPYWGLIGAAVASLIQKALSTGVYGYFGYRSNNRIDFYWSEMVLVPILFFVISYLGLQYINMSNLLITLVLKFFVILLGFGTVYIFSRNIRICVKDGIKLLRRIIDNIYGKSI